MIVLAGLQPFDPWGLALVALANPVVIITAIALGWHANQWAKIIVAGFAAAFAGAIAIWLATYLQVLPARGYGGEAGVFVMSFIYGSVLAGIAYAVRRGQAPRG